MFDLSRCKLFRSSEIENLSKYFSIQDYDENALIHFEGDLCNEISIILSGEIEIITYNYDGSLFVISSLGEGNIFGEILLYSSYKFYMGNVMSKTKVSIATITKEKLEMLFQLDSTIYHNFINIVCDRAFSMNTRLKLIGQKSIRERINHYINIQQTLGSSDKITIGKSKEELARFLNIPRPSLSRELLLMKQEGIIDYDRSYIYLLAPPFCNIIKND
ncbi:MAG: Crp/Fnr family transcriptional regulator [Candidatus Izemoplasmatales bacterium]